MIWPCGEGRLLTGEQQRRYYLWKLETISKPYIVQEGMTMKEAAERLADKYSWRSSAPNLSEKLHCGSLRYS